MAGERREGEMRARETENISNKYLYKASPPLHKQFGRSSRNFWVPTEQRNTDYAPKHLFLPMQTEQDLVSKEMAVQTLQKSIPADRQKTHLMN